MAFALDQSAHYPFMLGATNIQRQVDDDHLDYHNNDDDDDEYHKYIYDDDNDKDYDYICDDVRCHFILCVTHGYIHKHSSPHKPSTLIINCTTPNFYHNQILNCQFLSQKKLFTINLNHKMH